MLSSADSARTADEDILEYAQWMNFLREYAPFGEFRSLAQRMSEERIQLLLKSTGTRPPSSPTDEFLKGAIYGILLPFAAMENTLQQAQEIIRAREDQDDND